LVYQNNMQMPPTATTSAATKPEGALMTRPLFLLVLVVAGCPLVDCDPAFAVAPAALPVVPALLLLLPLPPPPAAVACGWPALVLPLMVSPGVNAAGKTVQKSQSPLDIEEYSLQDESCGQ
jgi:hypothetical protein